MDTLGLTTGKGAGLAVQGEVVQSHSMQKLDPVVELLQKVPSHLPLAIGPLSSRQPAPQILDAALRQLRQGLAFEADPERLGLQTGPATVRTRIIGTVARQQDPHMDLVGAALQPGEKGLQTDEISLPGPDESTRLLGEIAPRDIEGNAFLSAGSEELFIELLVGRGIPGRDGSLLQGPDRIRNDPLAVDADDPPEALTAGAGPERRIEREQRRLRLANHLEFLLRKAFPHRRQQRTGLRHRHAVSTRMGRIGIRHHQPGAAPEVAQKKSDLIYAYNLYATYNLYVSATCTCNLYVSGSCTWDLELARTTCYYQTIFGSI